MLTLETQDDPDGSPFARVRGRGELARQEQQLREELRAVDAEIATIPIVEPRFWMTCP
jgi:hypothetical protein